MASQEWSLGQTCGKCGKMNHFATACRSSFDGYRNDGYRNDGYRNDGYRNDGYRNDGYRNDGYRNAGYRNDGYRNRNRNDGNQNQQPPRPQPTPQNDKSRVRQVQDEAVEEASSSDDEYLYILGQDKTTPTVSLKIDDTIVEMIVDTGASMDILDEATFEKVNYLKHIELQPPTKRLFAYGSESQLKVLGKFEATIEFKGRCHTSTIHVLKGNHGSLLSYKTAADLGVVSKQSG